MKNFYISLFFLALTGAQNVLAVLYVNDARTRTEATEIDAAKIASASGTIFFIDETTAVTAGHVNTNDLLHYNKEYSATTEQILDSSPLFSDGGIDFKVIKIKWHKYDEVTRSFKEADESPKGLQLINKISDIEVPERSDTQVKLITENIKALGFPRDRGGPIESAGDTFFYLKLSAEKYSQYNTQPIALFFNAGVVAGNSGGPILDSKGHLLGIVTGGPSEDKDFEPIYNPNNVREFNWGISAKTLYEVSKPFREAIDRAAKTGK